MLRANPHEEVPMADDPSSDRRRTRDLVRGLRFRRSTPQSNAVGSPSPHRHEPAALRDIEDVIGDCALYEDGRRTPGRLALEGAGEAARDTAGFVWIGLQQPTAEEFSVVAQAFDLPELAVEDAIKAHQRPKLEAYGDIIFMVLKPVRYVNHDEVVDIAEIAFFLGPNFIVTVRHGHSEVLHRVRAEFDAGGQHQAGCTPSGVLYRAADLVVDQYEESIQSINDDVDDIETQVFSEDDVDHSERIYKLKREVAEFRRSVGPLTGPLGQLAEANVPGIAPTTAPYFRDVLDHAQRVGDAIDEHDRLLSDILQADLSRAAARQSQISVRQNEISVRQNEDMRKISAWAAIALVPTAIAGIYGMNFDNMPELGWTYGYFIVLGIIVTTCVVLHQLFRRNGWL
jgi:magnesium transporter